MQRLIEGAHKFRNEEFGRYKKLFKRLSAEGQKPHTLFITCSDSRVLAELITQSKPGDLFVVKNAGNIIPPASVTGSTNSTAAAIEFAVHILGVTDVVLCGHSQCGAMAALINGLPDPASFPHMQRWLEVASPVRDIVAKNYSHLENPQDRVTVTAQENVLHGLETLRTYPAVARALDAGALQLHGWFFKIASAELFAYDPEKKQFEPLLPDSEGAQA